TLISQVKEILIEESNVQPVPHPDSCFAVTSMASLMIFSSSFKPVDMYQRRYHWNRTHAVDGVSWGMMGIGASQGSELMIFDFGITDNIWWQMIVPIAVEDVKRKARILRALTGHENVVQFYNAFENSDYVYIVMEYVFYLIF
ncbi:hypothetical protein IFM89_036332, partial [Coptis chinensis]